MDSSSKRFLLVIYSQFAKVISPPPLVLMFNSILDQCNGLPFVDSSSIWVCKRYHIATNKVFAGIAARDKTTKGQFYGLKLHLIINRGCGVVKASFSASNKDDRKQLDLNLILL